MVEGRLFLVEGSFFSFFFFFNLENNFFQVVGVEHRFTPSLPVRHLETRGELPFEKAARSALRKI